MQKVVAKPFLPFPNHRAIVFWVPQNWIPQIGEKYQTLFLPSPNLRSCLLSLKVCGFFQGHSCNKVERFWQKPAIFSLMPRWNSMFAGRFHRCSCTRIVSFSLRLSVLVTKCCERFAFARSVLTCSRAKIWQFWPLSSSVPQECHWTKRWIYKNI